MVSEDLYRVSGVNRFRSRLILGVFEVPVKAVGGVETFEGCRSWSKAPSYGVVVGTFAFILQFYRYVENWLVPYAQEAILRSFRPPYRTKY